MKLFTFLAAVLLFVACGDDKESPNDYQARPESKTMDFLGGMCPPDQGPDQRPCPECPACPDQKPCPKCPDQNTPPDPKPPKQDPKPPKQDPDQRPPKQDPDQRPPKQDPGQNEPKDPKPPKQNPDPKPPKQDPDQKMCVCQSSKATVVVTSTGSEVGDWCQDVDSGAWYYVNECI